MPAVSVRPGDELAVPKRLVRDDVDRDRDRAK
jgi:hypothetical protein